MKLFYRGRHAAKTNPQPEPSHGPIGLLDIDEILAHDTEPTLNPVGRESQVIPTAALNAPATGAG